MTKLKGKAKIKRTNSKNNCKSRKGNKCGYTVYYEHGIVRQDTVLSSNFTDEVESSCSEEGVCSSLEWDKRCLEQLQRRCSEEGACSSLEWDKRCLEQLQRRSEHLTMLEQSHCAAPQESLSSVSLNSDLSVCNNEYRTPPPRTNMVVHPKPESQQDGNVLKQPNDRMFTPLSQTWHTPHPVVDQQEDCNRQQEVQHTPPRYNSPGPTIDYNQQPRFLHTPTPDHVHFSPSVQHEHHNVNQYQHGFNSLHRLEVNQSQQPIIQSQIDIHSCPTNQHPGVDKVQQRVQMQHKVQCLQQRLDQLQQGVINFAQPVQQQHLAAAPVSLPQQRLQQQVCAVVYQQPNYPEPRCQPPSSVTGIQQHKMIGHPTSMFQPPRGGPPPQAPTNLTPYNQQLSATTITRASVTYMIPGTQQQPPPSGAPKRHYNQPSVRQKEYNSDYYGRQRRRDPRHQYTGDSDTSYVSAYRQTRTKRRSEPEYNRPKENQQRVLSPLRGVRIFPLHRSRSSPRRSRGSSDYQSESDTDMQSSTSSQEIAGTEACISKPKSMDAALDMIRWCQHTRKAVSAIQKTSKKAVDSLSENSVNSPVVLDVGSTKSSMDNRLSHIEEYIEKIMPTVTSLVQEQSAKHGTSPSSISPNQDNRYSDYSPSRNYGRGRGRGNNSGDRRYTRQGYYNNECFNCHQQGHYIKDCPDLYVQETGRQSVQKEPTSQQVSFDENNKDNSHESEGVVSGINTVRSLGAAKLFRVEVNIAGKKVLALVDSGSEVTILKDTIFYTLEPDHYVIRGDHHDNAMQTY
ncbi:unnamed protein product [Mytilus edulis]|uniref:CCHC-type domain-containing protein n=1 Tax=Mytilus edulis TaxID=6550 RepID=A0A8S3VGK8_MYTED|nr:unnamed protein product [Mytilus edulis]